MASRVRSAAAGSVRSRTGYASLGSTTRFEHLYDGAVESFWGVVVDQSCGDRGIPDGLEVVATLRTGGWELVLVEVPAAELEDAITELRARMVPIDDECWYAHFFRDDRLVVVFQDRVFVATTDDGSWSELLEYGRRRGIPDEQLDFEPRTVAGARERFAL